MRHAALPPLPPPSACDHLPLERIIPRPSLHRGEGSVSLQALAESIRRCGLMRPITVRRQGNARYLVVSGNRRLAACRMLGMLCVPVRILSDDARHQPAEQLLGALLMGRMHYLQEAEALRALHEVHRMSLEELSQALTLPLRTLEKLMQLTTLEDEVQSLLLEEAAPLTIAALLLRLPDAARRLDAAERITRERLCIRDSALLVASLLRERRKAPAQPSVPSPEASDGPSYLEGASPSGEAPASRAGRVVGVIRDERPYLNAIRNICGQMRAAGFPAALTENRRGGLRELTITLPIRRRRADRYREAQESMKQRSVGSNQ